MRMRLRLCGEQVHGGTEWGRVPRDHVEVRHSTKAAGFESRWVLTVVIFF